MEKSTFLRSNLANIVSLSIVPLSLIAFYCLFIGEVFLAFLMISFCFFLDTLDGNIARKLKIESEMGGSIDSFCDFIIYLAFPIYFIVQYLSYNPVATFFTALFILIAGIIKLSRFNSEGLVATEGNKYYRGLTVPFVLLVAAICYIVFDKISENIVYYVPFIMLAVSILMISSIKIKKSNNYLWYLLMILILWMIY